MANEWMDRYMHAPYGGMGLNAYNRMRTAGFSNQQIVAGARGRGLTIGQRVYDHSDFNTGAQPNWMNQYTGSGGNIGLSTYNRMKAAGYTVHDIQRDQPASGMRFGAKARDQMNKDLAQAMADEKAAQLAKHQAIAQPPPQMTTAGAGDIGADANAQGVKTGLGIVGSNEGMGSTTDAFSRSDYINTYGKPDPKKKLKNGLPTSGITA